MTPLGQQIARLLQPEHWEEWDLYFGCLRHKPTSLQLDILWFEVYGAGLGMLDRMRLWRAAYRLERYLMKRRREQAIEELSQRLMSEEERAIEELLRS